MSVVAKLVKGVITVVVVALLGLTVWVQFFFDAEAVRDQLTMVVEEKSGHRLEIREELMLSIFPQIGIETGGITLHSQSAGEAPLVEIKHVEMKVSLLPLLLSNLEADQLVVDGLQLNLLRNAEGRGNWESLLSPQPSEAAKQSDSSKLALGTIALGGIDIRNGSLRWEDRMAATQTVIEKIQLKSGPVSLDAPVSMQGGLSYRQNGEALQGTLHFEGQLELTQSLDKITLRDLKLVSENRGSALLDGQPLNAEFAGKVTVESQGEKVILDSMKLTLDQTTLQGNASLQQGEKMVVRFDLQGDQLNLDRYLPKEVSGGVVDPVAGSAAGVVQLPVQFLRQLDLLGDIRLDQFKVSGAQATAVAFQLKAQNGRVDVGPLTASLYDGSYRGTVTVDVSGSEQPGLAMEEVLSNVDLGQLVAEMASVDAVRGHFSADGKMTAVGLSKDEIMKSLSGAAIINVTEGAFKGVNIPRLIRQARALIGGKPLPSDSEPNETPFSDLKASVRAKDGKLVSDSLAIDTPVMRLTGKGWYALLTEEIEYRLTATVAKDLPKELMVGLEGLEGKPFPIIIHGSIRDPKVKVDLEGELQERIKQKIGDFLDGGGEQNEGVENLKKGFGGMLKKLF